jgi:hypothetical protein
MTVDYKSFFRNFLLDKHYFFDSDSANAFLDIFLLEYIITRIDKCSENL